MRALYRHILVALLLLAFLPVSGGVAVSARAQSTERPLVSIEVQNKSGFVRLVFEWAGVSSTPTPPEHTAELENGVLVIHFAQDYRIDADVLLEQAIDTVALVRQDSDNRTLRLALKNPIRIQSSVDQLQFAVDLIPEGSDLNPAPYVSPRQAIDTDLLVVTGAMRKVPTAAELRHLQIAAKPIPADAPRLPVRVIRNDTRSRVVFQWPEVVGYDIIRQDDTLVINFNQIARPSLARLRVEPPKFVKTADAVKRYGGLEVRIEIEPDADFIHFREDSDVIVDFLSAGTQMEEETVFREDPDEHKASEEHAEDAGHAEPPADNHTTEQQHEVASNEPASLDSEHAVTEEGHEPLVQEAAQGEESVAAHEEPVVAAASEHDPDTHAAAAPDAAHSGPANHEPSNHEPASIEPEHPEPVSHEPAPANSHVSETQTNETQARETHASDSKGLKHKPTFAVVDKVAIELIDTSEGVEVLFPWGRDVAASVFKRGDYLWVIFDALAEMDLSGFKRGSHFSIGELADFSTSDLTFIRLELGPRALVMVQPEHHAWRVILGETSASSTDNIELMTDVTKPGQARVYTDLPSANKVHHLEDPEVGDDIIVVTALGPAQGLMSKRKYIDFLALASAHGMAIQPVAEDLDVFIDDGIVSITKAGGLAVSGASTGPDMGRLEAGLHLDAPDAHIAQQPFEAGDIEEDPEGDVPGLLRWAEWAGSESDGYYGTLAKLNDRLAIAPKRARSRRRLDLARFYFAHGLLSETVGVLNTIFVEDPGFANVPQFVSLKGATQNLMHRNKLALKTLSHAAVRSDPGAAIWRGMAYEDLGFHKKARDEFAKGMTLEEQYPADWRAKFQLAETKAALGVHDLEDATIMWQNIHQGVMDDNTLAEAFLVKGQILRAIGEPALALEYFRKVFPLTDEEMAHRSRYEEVTMLYDVGEMEADDAIDRLDRLRYQWRGDDLELRSLRSLGEVYADEGRYREALTAMRTGFTFNPQHAISRDMRDTMSDIFEALFLEDKADELKLTSAIALFYDFKELTPIGTKGDRMIRLLSERLVSIGLLDQAAELLEHQVKYRLKGVARSQVAMRLALIQLRNKQPEKAFSAISSTRFAGLTPKLKGQRRLIEARALADMGRHDHAIELLEDDITPEAEILRANIFWDADNYPETGRIYEEMLEAEWGNNKELTDEARASVMRMSIAYALVDDRPALERVRRKFGAQMLQSPDAQGFNIATGDMALQGVAFRDVLRKVNSIDTFEAFMTDFKSRFGDDGTMVN